MSLVNCHFVSTQSVWWPCHFKCHHGNSKRPNSISSVFTNNELFLWALPWGHNSTEKCWIFREIYYTLKIVALYYTLSCICRLSISLGFVNGRMLCILWGWSAPFVTLLPSWAHFHPISTPESFYFSGCLLPPASEEAQLPLLNQGMLTVTLQEGQVLSRHPSCASP